MVIIAVEYAVFGVLTSALRTLGLADHQPQHVESRYQWQLRPLSPFHQRTSITRNYYNAYCDAATHVHVQKLLLTQRLR